MILFTALNCNCRYWKRCSWTPGLLAQQPQFSSLQAPKLAQVATRKTTDAQSLRGRGSIGAAMADQVCTRRWWVFRWASHHARMCG